ncbi:MAG TPA: hypothetical protein ENG92_05545, partial [Thiolapillus brandeum]|nr:hypothetical protein [Thiolapillus brandeum]
SDTTKEKRNFSVRGYLEKRDESARKSDIGNHTSPGFELDLRGKRADEALDILDGYLDSAFLVGLPFVRIIHGKGRGSSQQPVLKQKINQWLPQRKEVLAFCSAPRWDGGSGAAYVLLSRKWVENG